MIVSLFNEICSQKNSQYRSDEFIGVNSEKYIYMKGTFMINISKISISFAAKAVPETIIEDFCFFQQTDNR